MRRILEYLGAGSRADWCGSSRTRQHTGAAQVASPRGVDAQHLHSQTVNRNLMKREERSQGGTSSILSSSTQSTLYLTTPTD
eukprot:4646574-Pyramimonas_sp.AAC.1